MIKPKLYGRLGNQCFQISAAIAHAKRMGATWAIPRVTEDIRYWPNYFLHTVPLKRITMYATAHVHNENEHHNYEPLPLLEDLTINGYFQSEKYWPTHEEKYEIGNALGFHCKQQDYIAVHVRRGDFVTDYKDKHPPLPIEYYDEATDYFLQQGYDRYLIYSDDIAWCKREFGGKMGWNFEYNNIKDPLTAMRDMYNAAGLIIANSTFSLFPALLRLDNPVVVAPQEIRWYGPGNGHLSTKDLMPERFIKI